MRCSVVILNWNGKGWLQRFLPSVVEHTASDEVEVVVADNGSTDGSVEWLELEMPSVRICLLDRNYGFAEGYNRALEQVDAEYAVLLNSDVEVEAGWLEPLLKYMAEHTDVAACQPKILAYHSKDLPAHMFEHAGAAGGCLDRLGYPFCRGRRIATVEEDKGQYSTSNALFWASGACMLCRTELYKQAGGLDGRFFAHMEEIDLCWRLLSRGYKIACVTESRVWHVGGGTLNYQSPKKTYLNFRNDLLMLYKNLPESKLHLVLFCRFWLDYVAACQMLLTGQLRNFAAVLRARRDFWKMRRSYKKIRQENLKKSVADYPAAISKNILLIDYYLKGKK